MSANPLLDDALAEHHNYLLEAGNLKRKPPVFAPFVAKWSFSHHRARYQHTVCSFCSAETRTLVGIFRVETSQTATREISLPVSSDLPQTLQAAKLDHITTRNSVAYCANCLPILFPAT